MPFTHHLPLAHVWFTRICMENHSNMIVCFLIQILLIFGGRCNRYFWDIWLKLYSFINFSMLFQFVVTKFSNSELSSCFSESWSSDQLLQEAIRVSGVFFTLFIYLFFSIKKIVVPMQFFPSPVNPNGHGPQLIVSLFLKQVTLWKQESSVQSLMTNSQLAPVNPTLQLHV